MPETSRKQGQRSWTIEQRQALSAKLRARKIWLASTGPKTAQGKKISSQNNLKHGRYAKINTEFKRWLTRQRKFLSHVLRQQKLLRARRKALLDRLKAFNRGPLLSLSSPASKRHSGESRDPGGDDGIDKGRITNKKFQCHCERSAAIQAGVRPALADSIDHVSSLPCSLKNKFPEPRRARKERKRREEENRKLRVSFSKLRAFRGKNSFLFCPR